MKGFDRNLVAMTLFVLMLGVLVGLGFSGARMAAEQSSAALALSKPPVTVHQTRLGSVTATGVSIEFQATRHRSCSLSALAEWERPDGVRMSRANPNKATLRPGTTHWIELQISRPPELPSGSYRVRSVGEYHCPDGQVFIVPTDWLEVDLP